LLSWNVFSAEKSSPFPGVELGSKVKDQSEGHFGSQAGGPLSGNGSHSIYGITTRIKNVIITRASPRGIIEQSRE